MLFAIICTDRTDAGDTRSRTREAHLRYLDQNIDTLVHVGPLLDARGVPVGSLVVVDVADHAAATAMAQQDPYALAGLFESVAIHAHRLVYANGARLA